MQWPLLTLVVVFATLSFFFTSITAQYVARPAPFYPELPLPSNGGSTDAKKNGYVWHLGLVGWFSGANEVSGPGVMQFAADEINNNDNLIPGVRLQLHYTETKNLATNAVMAAFSQLQYTGVRGIAGGFASQETVDMQLVINGFKVPSISGRANADDLSVKTAYPYFARLTLADSGQYAALVQLFAYYGWKRAIVVFQNDAYGLNGDSAWLNSNLEILSVKAPAAVVGANYSNSLAQIKKFTEGVDGCRVFLWYMIPPYHIPFMKAMGANYSTPDFVHVLTTPPASVVVEAPWAYGEALKYLDGAILLTAGVGTGKVYEEKMEKWNALNQSEYIGIRPDLYSFWNWYDTIYTFAHALHQIIIDRGAASNISVLDEVTGTEYFNAIKKVNFTGALGQIQFDSNVNLIGDAEIWNLAGGNLTAIGKYHGGSKRLEMTRKAVFYGGRLTVPPDSYIIPIKQLPDVITISMAVLTGLSFSVVFVVGAFFILRPEEFTKSGRFYCSIVLLGALVALTAAAIAIPEPTDALCIAFPWVLGIGFMIVFGCLFLRTWALFQVFRAAEKMKLVDLKPSFVLRVLAGFVMIEVIFMIIWTAVDPPQVELITVRGGDHRQYKCGPGNITFWGVFIGYKGLWMLFGAIISFMVRNVREDYNQSFGLGMAVYNCFGITIIAVVLGSILHDSPSSITVIEVLAILLAFTVTVILLFGNQVWGIIIGRPVSENEFNTSTNSLSRSQKTSNQSSKGNSAKNSASDKSPSVSTAAVYASEVSHSGREVYEV